MRLIVVTSTPATDDDAPVREPAQVPVAARDLAAVTLSAPALVGDAVMLGPLLARLGVSVHTPPAGGAAWVEVPDEQPADVEIERKYLLRGVPERARGAAVVEVEQGWLPGERLRERLRRTRSPEHGERYWRAIKAGRGLHRIEVEEETTPELFAALWPLTEGRRVVKRRYLVPEDGGVWEIDEFTDRELVLAEIELPTVDTAVIVPEWLRPHVVREVTDEPQYVNYRLAK